MAFPFPRKEMCRKLGLPQSPSSIFWTDWWFHTIQRGALRCSTGVLSAFAVEHRTDVAWGGRKALLAERIANKAVELWQVMKLRGGSRQRQLCCLPSGFLLRKTWESYVCILLVSVCLSPFRKLSKVASVSIAGFQYVATQHVAHHCTSLHHVTHVFSIFLPSQVQKELPPSRSELGSADSAEIGRFI